MACPFTKSADGHELQMATNHYGHYLLTVLLLDRMLDTAGWVLGLAEVLAVRAAMQQ